MVIIILVTIVFMIIIPSVHQLSKEQKDSINHFMIDLHKSIGLSRCLIEELVIGAGMSLEKVCTIIVYQWMSYFVFWVNKYLSG